MRVLIVEDEVYNYEGLKRKLLKVYPQAEIDGLVANLASLERAMLDQQRYDVIYCDIRLEDGVCFSVFAGMEITVPLVFTTAYSEFALQAFNANGIAYLLKPVKPDALRKATELALSIGRGRQNLGAMMESLGLNKQVSYLHFLRANTYDGYYIIDIAGVSHFEVKEKRVYAMMANGTMHRIDYTLEKLMQ